MATAAQDEYEALYNNQRLRANHHPEDSSSAEDEVPDAIEQERLNDKRKSSGRLSNATTVNPYNHSHSSNYIHATGTRLDDPSDSDRDDDESDYEDSTRNEHRKPTKYYLPRKYDSRAQTGPKGVIADAQAFEDAKKLGMRHNHARTVDLALPKSQRSELQSDEDWSSGSEAEVVKKWNQARMEELQLAATGAAGTLQAQQPKTVQRFKGKLKRVDCDGFLEAVEGAPKGMIVLVYIYDDQLLLSEAYESHLKALAGKHLPVMFVSLHYRDAEMEHAGVPALLAYRNGEKFAGLVPLSEEVPFTSNIGTNLEDCLWAQGMLE